MAIESIKNREYKGLSVSSGKVSAKICVYSQKRHIEVAAVNLETEEEIQKELQRFRDTISICNTELDNITDSVVKEVGKAEAEIFITQKHIMNDPVVIKQIEEGIVNGRRNAEYVITGVFQQYEKKFENIDNEYFSDRSSDIGEIRRRLLDRLSNTRPGFECDGQHDCVRGNDRVVVAQELSADMMTNMNMKRVLGLVTEHGGINSHAAIIARSLGVPAVSGVRGIYKDISCGMDILVDGDSGIVILEPDEATVKKLITVDYVSMEKVCMLESPKGTIVQANASMIEDVQQSVSVRADGIGLFRTEISFINTNRLLTEDEQYDFYSEIQRLMGDKPVTFRLLDVGGDKELPFLQIEKEENPFLGLRGARFLLENPVVFRPQVKALLRLSKQKPVRILFPMIIDNSQLGKLISAIREIMVSVDAVSENIRFGAMFEVPSACLQADKILKAVDFGSIGSNDLIQYLFAVDRNNESVSDDYNPDHPVLWDLLKDISEAAKRADKALSMCGELAGRPNMPSRLLDIGITSLSVSPRLIPRVRNELLKYKGLE